jgi:hypothetical protein
VSAGAVVKLYQYSVDILFGKGKEESRVAANSTASDGARDGARDNASGGDDDEQERETFEVRR